MAVCGRQVVRIAALELALALVTAACNSSLQRCKVDSDCPPQQWCDELQVCVTYARPTSCGTDGGACDGGGGGGVTCAPACAQWQECSQTPAGGSCVDLALTLVWAKPSQGAHFGLSIASSLGVELLVSRADGGYFGGGVPFTLEGRWTGTLRPSGQAWVATIDAGLDEGTRKLVAGWGTGPADAVTTFDVVGPPRVSLFVEAPAPRADDDTDQDGQPRWKKSEVAPIQVESSRRLPALGPSSFTIAGVAPSTRCSRICAAGSSCSCFEIDLAQQTLEAAPGSLFGTVSVGLAQMKDEYENVTPAVAPVPIPVTRLKWTRLLENGSAPPSGVAVAPDGTVVVGYSVPNAAPLKVAAVVEAFRPDGGVIWKNSTLAKAVRSGPIVRSTTAFTSHAGQSPVIIQQIVRTKLADGSTAVQCSSDTSGFTGDMAVMSTGSGENAAAVSTNGDLIGGGPSALSCSMVSCFSSFQPDSEHPTVVIAGDVALVGSDQRDQVFKVGIDGGAFSLPDSIWTTPLNPKSLFVSGAVAGGGGQGSAVGGVMAFNFTGDLYGTSPSDTSPGSWGAAVLAIVNGSAWAYQGTSEHISRVRVSPTVSSVQLDSRVASAQIPAVAFSDHSPLVGRGGRLFVIGNDGAVRAFDLATLAERWRWDGTLGLSSELNLDINRDAPQPCASGQPGVLYVVAFSATGWHAGTPDTRLYAVLVDSAGLERAAPWPRHQHDPGSTGNSTTSLVPYTCP